MKRFLLILIAVFAMSLSVSGPIRTTNQVITVVKDGYQLLDRPTDRRLLAFRAPNGKIGFVSNSSIPVVHFLPVFEDAIVKKSTLVGVKYEGKWGAVDTSFDGDPDNRLVIPCEYDGIEIIDNYRAKVLKNKKHWWILDIRDLSKITYTGN